MKTIYLAGPISGENIDNAHTHFLQRVHDLRAQCVIAGSFFSTILNPMSGVEKILGTGGEAKPSGYTDAVSCDQAILRRDRWMVSQADIVLVDLSYCARPSLGTMAEMAWAYDQKHTLVVVGGLEPGGYMDHAFVKQCGDIFFDTYEEAEAFVAQTTKN